MAVDDAGDRHHRRNGDRVGVITGCGLGGLRFMEDTVLTIHQNGPKRVSPFFHPHDDRQHGARDDIDLFGARGPNLSLATACAAGAHAVGDSFKVIQEGRADAMITGGTEAVISPSCVAGFNAMKALSTRNAEPREPRGRSTATATGSCRGKGGHPHPGGARARPPA